MKILKNLMGKNDKIHVDEIAVNPKNLLSDTVIVETGSNSNGHWIKWGNGFMICWREDIINRDSTKDKLGVDKPIAFNADYPIFGGISTTASKGNDRIDAWMMMLSNYHNSWTYGLNYNQFNSWVGSGNLEVILWSIGFVD